MLEILQITEAVLVATAVTLTVVATPAAILTGEEIPDIKPLIELIEKDGEDKSYVSFLWKGTRKSSYKDLFVWLSEYDDYSW